MLEWVVRRFAQDASCLLGIDRSNERLDGIEAHKLGVGAQVLAWIPRSVLVLSTSPFNLGRTQVTSKWTLER